MSPDNCKHHHPQARAVSRCSSPSGVHCRIGRSPNQSKIRNGPPLPTLSSPWHVCAFQHDHGRRFRAPEGSQALSPCCRPGQTDRGNRGGTYLFACLLIAGFSWAGLVLGPREIDLRPEPAVCSPGKTLPRPRSQGKDLVGRAMGNVISEYHRQLACPREQQQRGGGAVIDLVAWLVTGRQWVGMGSIRKQSTRWGGWCFVRATQYLHILSSRLITNSKVCGLECPLQAGKEQPSRRRDGRRRASNLAVSFACSFVRSSARSLARPWTEIEPIILGWANNAVKRGSYAVPPPRTIGSRSFCGGRELLVRVRPPKKARGFLDMPHIYHPCHGGIEGTREG